MTTLAKIIDFSMHHHGATNDGVLSCQGDHGVSDVNLGGSTSGLNIAKVTNMSLTLRISRSSMRAAIWVKVRSSTGAAIGVITKLEGKVNL